VHKQRHLVIDGVAAIRKVGDSVGGATYGVNNYDMEQFFLRSFAQSNDLTITHIEYANALTYVYGDAAQPKVREQLQLAIQTTPICAMDKLEIEYAKQTLAHLELSTAQR
jgi:hypothetical protein